MEQDPNVPKATVTLMHDMTHSRSLQRLSFVIVKNVRVGSVSGIGLYSKLWFRYKFWNKTSHHGWECVTFTPALPLDFSSQHPTPNTPLIFVPLIYAPFFPFVFSSTSRSVVWVLTEPISCVLMLVFWKLLPVLFTWLSFAFTSASCLLCDGM